MLRSLRSLYQMFWGWVEGWILNKSPSVAAVACDGHWVSITAFCHKEAQERQRLAQGRPACWYQSRAQALSTWPSFPGSFLLHSKGTGALMSSAWVAVKINYPEYEPHHAASETGEAGRDV